MQHLHLPFIIMLQPIRMSRIDQMTPVAMAERTLRALRRNVRPIRMTRPGVIMWCGHLQYMGACGMDPDGCIGMLSMGNVRSGPFFGNVLLDAWQPRRL